MAGRHVPRPWSSRCKGFLEGRGERKCFHNIYWSQATRWPMRSLPEKAWLESGDPAMERQSSVMGRWKMC